MRLRSWRGSVPLSPSTRRAFPWARLLLVLAVVGLAAYLIVPNIYYLRADALVQGQLVPVSPLYRARIDKLLVECDDHVSAGQEVAVISNFLVQADYQRQYLQSASQLALSKIASSDKVAQAEANVAALQQKYVAAKLDAKRLGDQFGAFDQAYAQGAISEFDWQTKRTEWQAAIATAEGDHQALLRAVQDVARVRSDANANIASDEQLSNQAQSLAARVGEEPLRAPVGGYIVDCIDRPQNVIEPSTPIFDIFDPNRAYVLAYFDPNSIDKVSLNERVDVQIAGVKHTLTGRIGAIYPDLSKLPPQLTRFFWQHIQWSEYRPVRILLDHVSPQDRARLYYDAQARVSIALRGSPVPKSVSER
jgi:multidrug resistance efflux pump